MVNYTTLEDEPDDVLDDESTRSHAEVITSLYRSDDDEPPTVSGEKSNARRRRRRPSVKGGGGSRDASPLSVVDRGDDNSIDGSERSKGSRRRRQSERGRPTRRKSLSSSTQQQRKETGQLLDGSSKNASEEDELNSSFSTCGSSISRSSRRGSLSVGRRNVSRSRNRSRSRSLSTSSRKVTTGGKNLPNEGGGLDRSLSSCSSTRRRSLCRRNSGMSNGSSRSLSSSASRRGSISKSSGSINLLGGENNSPPKQGGLERSLSSCGSTRRNSLSRRNTMADGSSRSLSSSASRRGSISSSSGSMKLLGGENDSPSKEGGLERSLSSCGSSRSNLSRRNSISRRSLSRGRRSLSRSASRRSLSRSASRRSLSRSASRRSISRSSGSMLEANTRPKESDLDMSLGRRGRLSTRNSITHTGSRSLSKTNRLSSMGNTVASRIADGQRGERKKREGRLQGRSELSGNAVHSKKKLGRSNTQDGPTLGKDKKKKYKRWNSVCGTSDTQKPNKRDGLPKQMLYGDKVQMGKVDAKADVLKLKAAKRAKKSRKESRRRASVDGGREEMTENEATFTGSKEEGQKESKKTVVTAGPFKLRW